MRISALLRTAAAAAVLLLLSSCAASADSTAEQSAGQSSAAVSDSSAVSQPDSDGGIRTASSSLRLPLSAGDWGNCSKYSTEEKSYVNVPVRVTAVVSGKEAEKRVKAFADESDSFAYTPPDEGAVWVIADYELSLDGFPTGKGGTTADITAFIVPDDGGMFSLNGKNYIPSVVNISGEEYYHHGIICGTIAYILPDDADEYIIALGEYEETQAFITVK